MMSKEFEICPEDLWQVSRQHAQAIDPKDASDRIVPCPSPWGEGYKRDIELRNGIDLTFHHYTLKDDLMICRLPPGETGCLEWVFTLSSGFRLCEQVQVRQGQHLLAGAISPGGTYEVSGRTLTLEVDIHLKPELFQTLFGEEIDQLPTELQRMLALDESLPFSPVRNITPGMQIGLQQMLDCPYQGVMKQMYLESKAIEVLVLWLDQVNTSDRSSRDLPAPKTGDIDRIYQAKEILLQHLDNPPSLLSLAHQVGLNDCTLKREFKQVFGTTVFGCLHQHRMEKARSLILENQHPITAIAQIVGYTNLSAFSSAFRKQYGVSPRAMQGYK